ncbi:MAG: hypothetical protein K6F13_07070 [Lachnospiraceae bacterium]|nr:hypothetical protein [Lachnospiraceae bacterium]
MAELKIIYAEDVPQQDFRPIPWQIRMEAKESGMKCFYSAHWVYPKPEEPEGEAPAEAPKLAIHPPHEHKENEVIMLIGGDPYDPYDLGATVEFSFGEDMKKYTFTRSVTIMIPAGMPHGFYNIAECHRPFMFVSSRESGLLSEKFRWDFLTEEEIAQVEHRDFWQDVGYDD